MNWMYKASMSTFSGFSGSIGRRWWTPTPLSEPGLHAANGPFEVFEAVKAN